MSIQDRYRNYAADQKRFFDELITECWEQYASKDWDRVRRFEIARLLAATRPASILDVGCGCGFHDVEMARFPFVECVDAIDYSPKSIEKAEAHYPHPKVRRQVADLAQFHPPRPYDLVVSFQVIEHMEDAAEFLRQCARCCRPGGHVAAFTVHLMRPYNRKRRRAGRPPEMEDPMHKCEFTRADLRQIGLEAQLQPRRIFSYAAEGTRLPCAARLWLGYLIPSQATRLAALYRKPLAGDS